MKRVAALILGIGLTTLTVANEVRELTWDDLIPPDWVPENPFDKLTPEQLNNLSDDSSEAQRLMMELQAVLAASPVVEDFQGERVKLPGFPVPLEGDSEAITELLLVPYFGACIHTPPPPANQIVYVKAEDGLEIGGIYDPVWITGKLSATHVSSDLGDAGYTLEAEKVEPYEY